MLGFFSRLLGSDTVIEKGMTLLDDIYTSDEERAVAKMELVKAYAPFKVAQRWIAIIFTCNFVAMFWVAVALWYFERDIAGFMEILNTFDMGIVMALIVSFYFAGGVTDSVFRGLRRNTEAGTAPKPKT